MAAAAHPGPGSTEERRHENQLAPPAPGSGTPQLQVRPGRHPSTRARERLKQRLLQKLRQKRKVLMERRRMIIQNIPDFWSKVFVNHSQISPIICDKDEDILSCMTNLEVAKLKHPRKRFKIRLFFRSNPYFSNTVIVKEYRANLNGYRAYRSSPIKWLQDYMGEAPRRMEYNNSVSIFNWFVDHNFVDSSRIAEIIYKDIWLKPLPYYLGTQVSEDGMEKGDEQPVTLESFSFRIESVRDV